MLTRVAAGRMLELLEEDGTVEGKMALANVTSTAAARVASLLKTEKYLDADGDALGATLEEERSRGRGRGRAELVAARDEAV